MKPISDPFTKKKAESVQKRPVGPAAEQLDEKKKKLMNLKEESQHSIGKDRLASDEVDRETDRSGR